MSTNYDELSAEVEDIRAQMKRLSTRRREIEGIIKEQIHHRGYCRGGGKTYTLIEVEKIVHDPCFVVGFIIEELGVTPEQAVRASCIVENKRLDAAIFGGVAPARFDEVRARLMEHAVKKYTTRFHAANG